MTHYNGMVLSLDKDTDRRQSFYAQLENLKITNPSITTFLAIDGTTQDGRAFIDENFDFEKASEIYGRRLSYGEAACSLSHIEIMRLLAQEADYAVILEDDAKFSKDFYKLPKVLDESPYDIVVFGESKIRSFRGGKRQKRANPLQLFAPKIAGLKLGIVYDIYTPGTVGYAVSNRFIKLILDYVTQHKCCWLADDFGYFFKVLSKSKKINLTCGFVFPRLVIEDIKIKSHLEEERLQLIESYEGVYKRPPLYKRIIPKFYWVQRLYRSYIAYRNIPQFDEEMLARVERNKLPK